MKTKMTGWRALLAVAGACVLMGTYAQGSRFDRIYSFGDSLSDASNLGPFSNGPVWPQYLAGYLDLDLYDYAYAGALTGYEGVLLGFAGEVDLFLSEVAEEDISNRDLFILAIGGNDFIDYFVGGGANPIPGGIENTVAGVQRLLEAGARYMVVWTAPDLAVTPATAFLSPEEKAGVSMLTDAYNELLVAALEDMASGYNCKLVIVDVNLAFRDMLANPSDYGLTNVEIPAYLGGVDPDTSLFWDEIHPTTYGHQLLAEFTLDTMLEKLVPGQAIGLEMNVPGWVHY